MADGSLTFDTKWDESSFKAAMDDLTKAVKDGLSEISGKMDAIATLINSDFETSMASVQKQVKNTVSQVKEDLSGGISTAGASTKRAMNDVKEEAEKGLGSAADGVSKQSLALATTVGTALGNLAGGLINSAVSGAKQYIADSIELASNLSEVQNVVDTTFGDSADEVNKWAKTAKNAYGMSELKAKKYASTMGSMLKSMGMTNDETLGMSENLTGLAGDMASFYNLDYDEAFEKIRSGISGETEPLKQLGINMSVANLEAYALSQGIDKTYDSMSQSEQATLRYNYLMQATADAQGDFARTSDGYANQQRILDTTLEELSATFGSLLLPAATHVATVLNGVASRASEALTSVADFFAAQNVENKLGDEIEATKTDLENVKDAIQTIRKDYSLSVIEIEVNYKKSETLIADLQALQSEGTLTQEQITKMQSISASLVDLYPGLQQYVGADGIIHKEAGEVQGLITQYANLDRQLAYSTMVSSLEQQQLESEVQRAILQEQADTAYAEWQANLEMSKQFNEYAMNINKQSLAAQGMLDAATIATSDNLKVSDYVDSVQKYFELFDDAKLVNVDTSKIKDLSLLFNDMGELKSADEISASGDAMSALYQLVIAIANTASTTASETQQVTENANANAATAQQALEDYNAVFEQTGKDLEAAKAVFKDKWGISVEDFQAQQQAILGVGDAATSTADDLTSANEKKAQYIDDLSAETQKAEQLNTRLSEAKDAVADAAAEQQAAIDKDQELADLTQRIADNIETARQSGLDAVQALQNQRLTLSDNAQAMVTELETFATKLGLYVAAMKDTMTQTVEDAKTEAATAAAHFAQGMKDGFEEKPYLQDAMEKTMNQSLAIMRSYFNAFETAGYEMADHMADGVRSGESELAAAVRQICRNAAAVAQNYSNPYSNIPGIDGSHALGLNRVPYDGYVAELHRNEAVLTAPEASVWRALQGADGDAGFDPSGIIQAIREGNGGAPIYIGLSIDGEDLSTIIEPKISELQSKRLRLRT
ncbi:MAG: hypothetical protein PHY64_09665 [Eubacteriales bacterium]|nr:hypothetical protein [Eubacteriales bacterium]